MRYQFSLRTALVAVTIFGCILAIGRALPVGARQLAICFSIVAILSSLVFFLLMKMDQVFTFKESPDSSPIGGAALVSICSTAILIILLAFWMQLPFRTGTAQLAVGNPYYMFVLDLRTAVTLSILGAPFFCAALQKIIIGEKSSSSRVWMLIGFVSFIVALILVVKSGFIPMT